MKKCLTGIRILSLLLLCFCLAALWRLPMTELKKPEPLPRARRQMITVWVCGDRLGALGWVGEGAAAYQKAHDGVNIWVRTASRADIDLLKADFAHAAPDLMLFMAGEEIDPAWLQEIAFCKNRGGIYEGRQLAVPVCMAGYALVQASKEIKTPAPTSLFGVTPTPLKAPASTPVPQADWPQKIVTDDRFGAWLLPLTGVTGRTLPEREAMEVFLKGEAEAALLSTDALRKLSAQGKGMEMLSPASQTDLVLYGGWMRESSPEACGFLKFLCSKEMQRRLSEQGLFSPHGETLYGEGTPILQSVEQALNPGEVENAFDWLHRAQSTFLTGQAMSDMN